MAKIVIPENDLHKQLAEVKLQLDTCIKYKAAYVAMEDIATTEVRNLHSKLAYAIEQFNKIKDLSHGDIVYVYAKDAIEELCK